MDDQDRVPVRFKWLVHHGLIDHVYGAVHRRRGCWIDPRLNRAVFFKEPLDFYVFAFWSFHLYKPSQTGPESYALAPVFSKA
jgi:hypothetical protein